MLSLLCFCLMSFSTVDVDLSKVVNSLKPDNLVFEFDKKRLEQEPKLISYVKGVGHMPMTTEFITFHRFEDKVNVVRFVYSNVSLNDGTKEKDFYYLITQAEFSKEQFKALTDYLSRVHFMKTYKEFKIHFDAPVGFNNKKTTHSELGEKLSMMTSVNYARLVNVWGEGDAGFNYSFAGYYGSLDEDKSLKVNVMAAVIDIYLEKLKFRKIENLLPEHKEIFTHQKSLVLEKTEKKHWKWVIERINKLDAAVI